MNASYTDLFALLDSLSDALVKLTEVEKSKAAAVRSDDLDALNECIKQEQALSMTLRGYEQKQRNVSLALSLGDVPLSKIPSVCPDDLHLRAKESVENLQRCYKLYRSAADTALSMLECNLHEIEKILAGAENPVAPMDYPNAAKEVPDLPSAMKTDIRA